MTWLLNANESWAGQGGGFTLADAASHAEFVRCCCPRGCCPCPTPTCVTALFEIISGPACPAIEGYSYVIPAPPLEPGEECPQKWLGDHVVVGEGEIEMTLECKSGTEYELLNVVGGLSSPEAPNEGGPARLISVSCDPFKMVYEFSIDGGAATICNNETPEPQIVRVTITPC